MYGRRSTTVPAKPRPDDGPREWDHEVGTRSGSPPGQRLPEVLLVLGYTESGRGVPETDHAHRQVDAKATERLSCSLRPRL